MKIKKVVGKAEVAASNEGAHYAKWEKDTLRDCPIGAPLELVATIDVEKKLIRPPGAAWETVAGRLLPQTNYNASLLVLAKGSIVASVFADTYRTVAKSSSGHGTESAAQLAAEHALANAGLYGFGWKSEDYLLYFLVFEEYRESRGQWYPDFKTLQTSAVVCQKKKILACYGITKEGEAVKIELGGET